MRVLLERVIATQESHGAELCLVRKEAREHREWVRDEIIKMSVRMGEHRVGWRVIAGLGAAALAALATLAAYGRLGPP